APGTSRGALSRTPEYASPEQIRGDPLDVRTDIYSLGATLYHLLSGKPPYIGAGPDEITEKVLRDDPPPLRNVPKPLAATVRRAMARDREKRYASIAEFATGLEAWLEKSRSGLRLRPAWSLIGMLPTPSSWAGGVSIPSASL